jgi:uncharacterized protein (DUF1501 family)
MKESRREFLKQSCCGALGMAAMATQMHHFGTISAYAQKAIDDNRGEGGANYKALVMLYFDGGNDSNNMFIPVHNDSQISNYAAYVAARGQQPFNGNPGSSFELGFTQTQLQNTNFNVPRLGNLTYAMHPSFGAGVTGAINNGIYELYGQGKLAIVANVGTLVRPLSKGATYNATPKPYQIGSHSDQKTQFQTSVSHTQSFTGWGGRVSDRLTTVHNPNGLVPMITSIAGAQLFTAGQTTLPMAIGDSNTNLNAVLNPAGFGTTPTGANLARRNAFDALRQQDLNSNYVAAASHVTNLAMNANAALQVTQDTTVPFPNTGIGRQLRQVARLIKERNDLNINRQIFYVQIGGFDTHTGELSETNGQNARLREVSQAMRSFYEEMIVQGVSNDVTLFTMSEFGRTLNPAGAGVNVGTDHGWGSHMMVMGGAVAGGNVYGSKRPNGTGDYFPTLLMGNNPAAFDDADTGANGRGRWIPTTSVDQYAAQLARWFGLPQDPATLNAVFPNLQFFPETNSQLGFLP